ncbi:DUF6497 family protein [Celeribacter litoreus]|uniref:DUF6497 family protein n=1 Tax=Celeribacter litoreus TaxID=2876714 RepID=UPI001CCCA964|nr:DUF6497 family protein [Celeribacter litoreus]MCA0042965.1 DUF6497 family protein [Celeribacter litoreus]
MIAKVSAVAALTVCMALAASAELTPIEAQELVVPSGQPVEFFESIMDRPAMGLTARFRFLAPELPAYLTRLPYEEVEADLAALCNDYALPRLANPRPSMVIISLSSEEVPFGESAPEVTQVFEAYRPEDTGCAWEAF